MAISGTTKIENHSNTTYAWKHVFDDNRLISRL